MQKSVFSGLKKWFAAYARGFLSDDAAYNRNIRLKIRHTVRVSRHMAAFADSLGEGNEGRSLAEAIGLLHDIGRFRQYQRYGSFDDRLTEDHARLALRVIEEEGCIALTDGKEQEIIVKAVSYHNRLRIPDGEEKKVLLFSKMIRDADKLDIFDLAVGNYAQRRTEQNPAIDLELPDMEGYRLEYINDLLGNRLCDNRYLECVNDVKLLRLSWIFDLNFSYSFGYVQQTRYIEKIMKHLPDTEEMKNVCKHLMGYIEERVGEAS